MNDLKNTAQIFKALSHETRLAIVIGLMKGDGCNVSKIIEKLGIPQSTVSQHIGVLRAAGIIEGFRKGPQICYKVTHKIVINCLKNMELDL